jgi:hypothetical protein
LQLLNLPPLLLDLLLLRLNLGLGLRVRILLILHRIADDEAGARAERAANRSARTRSADRRADYRAGASTYQCSYTGSFLTGAERLAGASGKRHQHRACNQNRY